MDGLEFLNNPAAVTSLWLIALLWTFFWKGLGLWRSAQQKQNIWFVAILIINSLGLLEIIYLFSFSKEKLTLTNLKNYFTTENLKSLFGTKKQDRKKVNLPKV